mmetsp:Transcript_42136/g.109035  ORF Transcript_42136/g.109035 Transcript_42136/m.109035 type:complete len:86 (-) Transcript_42136:213-470(-)
MVYMWWLLITFCLQNFLLAGFGSEEYRKSSWMAMACNPKIGASVSPSTPCRGAMLALGNHGRLSLAAPQPSRASTTIHMCGSRAR